MLKNISNEEFENAMKCIDNIKIMKKASMPYRQTIPYDDLESCCLNALWTSLQKYNADKQKFTSYLYQKVKWECLRYIAQERKRKNISNYYYDNMPVKNIETGYNSNYNDVLDCLPDDLKIVIVQYYKENMTLKEIGKKNGYSHETARKKIRKAIKHARTEIGV